MQCKTERATRICDQCTFDRRRNLSWGGGKSHLCFVCFAVRNRQENLVRFWNRLKLLMLLCSVGELDHPENTGLENPTLSAIG